LEIRTRFDLEVKTSEGSIVEIWNSNIVPCPRIPNILPKKSCAASRSRAHNLLELANAWTQTRREYGIFNQKSNVVNGEIAWSLFLFLHVSFVYKTM